ncbi:hypothetical protein L3X38_006865 [Prunus dulcis]|uniref:Uncharacterized protein n=1 Tax=Prunus dulcis TaxID=3755 RepID=A0AAD5F5D3_PRUDU|nr:hypothetical protein L3X38_006865 [Prunus dulcis]
MLGSNPTGNRKKGVQCNSSAEAFSISSKEPSASTISISPHPHQLQRQSESYLHSARAVPYLSLQIFGLSQVLKPHVWQQLNLPTYMNKVIDESDKMIA